MVVDLPASVLDSVIDTCANTVMDIQLESLLKAFPDKPKEDVFSIVKVFDFQTFCQSICLIQHYRSTASQINQVGYHKTMQCG